MTKKLNWRGLGTLAATAALLLGTPACTKDLDRKPFYDLTADTVYRDPANYIQVLAKLYAGFGLSGQTTTGSPDVSGPDEGASSYLRAYWKVQELPTDEAVVAWNDGNIQPLNTLSWNSSNDYVRYAYNRIFYEVAICNDFIRETSDDKLSSRGIAGQDATNARLYRAEARFLRALAYSHALDLFGNTPFVTEEQVPGSSTLPPQTTRAALFTYVESELKAIETQLGQPRQPGYGRADRAAAWTLLARLYLNAEVYAGTARYTDCLTYCNKVLGAGYALAPEYRLLFLADNDVTASSEIIFPLVFDGLKSQTYGGTTYLVHAAIGGRLLASGLGVSSGWAGNRTRKNLPQLFASAAGADSRALFYTSGQSLEIQPSTASPNPLIDFTQGYAVTKWRNKTSTGAVGSDPTGTFVDTDYPLLRLADVMLMYAEAVQRGGQGGNATTALDYVNQVRRRAYGEPLTTPSATADVPALTTDLLLDERGRELYWEASRRTDLIRFGRFTSGSYLWPYKGGTPAGQAVDGKFNLYPLPSTDIVANPNLKQNTGY